MLTHPTGLFSGDYISAPWVCWLLKFFTHPTSPIHCISSQSWGTGQPHVGFCPIFLVLHLFVFLLSLRLSVVDIDAVHNSWHGVHKFVYCWFVLLVAKTLVLLFRLSFTSHCWRVSLMCACSIWRTQRHTIKLCLGYWWWWWASEGTQAWPAKELR